jgi:hypothetical protein
VEGGEEGADEGGRDEEEGRDKDEGSLVGGRGPA